MLRHTDRIAIAVAVLTTVGATQATGQTIGDYSRSQRAVIEAAIARHGQSGSPVPAPLPAAIQAPMPLPVLTRAERAAPADGQAPPEPAVAPTVTVTGAFASASIAMAEVAVDGVAFMLAPGDGVPGTSWVLDAVDGHRVVMSRGSPRGGRPTLRTFLIAGEGR